MKIDDEKNEAKQYETMQTNKGPDLDTRVAQHHELRVSRVHELAELRRQMRRVLVGASAAALLQPVRDAPNHKDTTSRTRDGRNYVRLGGLCRLHGGFSGRGDRVCRAVGVAIVVNS